MKLQHIEVEAGRSTQATLLGRDEATVESLYLSPALATDAGTLPRRVHRRAAEQPSLF